MPEHVPDEWVPFWTRRTDGPTEARHQDQRGESSSPQEIAAFLRDLAIIVASLLATLGLLRLAVMLVG